MAKLDIECWHHPPLSNARGDLKSHFRSPGSIVEVCVEKVSYSHKSFWYSVRSQNTPNAVSVCESYQKSSQSRRNCCAIYCLCHSMHCSTMFRKINLHWSTHSLSFVKPTYSFLGTTLSAGVMRFTMIVQNILLGMERSVLPCQLLQLARLPFLGKATMLPFFHSDGICSLSLIQVKRGRRIVAANSWSAS